MNKKPKQEDDVDSDIELVRVSRKTDLDSLIEDYKEEARQRDTTPSMTLYKFENDKHGKERELMGYFVGEEIPEKNQIGIMYGGGRYLVFLKNVKGTAQNIEQTNLIIKISHVYDAQKIKYDEQKRREEIAKFSGVSGLGTPQLAAPGNGMAETFVMLKELIALIMPAIKAQTAAAAAQPVLQQSPDILTQYSLMQKVLQKNLFDTAETYRTFNQRYRVDNQETNIIDDGTTAEEPKETSLMDQVGKFIKMIEPFFGLIAKKGSVAQLTAQTVRAAPQFMEIVGDPQLCRMIVQYFDKTKGIDASNQALSNLGINRAKLFGSATPGAIGATASQTDHAAASTPGRPSNGKIKPNTAARVAARQTA